MVFKPKRFTPLELQKAQIFSHEQFYSWWQSVKKLFARKWLDLGIAHYARNLNRNWKRKNKTFMKVMDLLSPKKNVKISVDYREEVVLEESKKAA